MQIQFTCLPAFMLECPIDGERWIGGNPDEDPRTYAWVERHGKFHEKFPDSKSAPPIQSNNGGIII